MSTNPIGPLALHFRIRALAVLRSPGDLVVLTLLCGASVLVLPGSMAPSWEPAGGLPGVSDLQGPYHVMVWWLWLYLWPALPMIAAAGRVDGRGLDSGLGHRALPALPVGPRTRTLAEVALVTTTLGIVWAAFALTGWRPAGETVMWVTTLFTALPMLVVWGLPSPSLDLFMLRPLVVAAVMTGLGASGWLRTPAAAALSALVVAAAVLAIAGVNPQLDRLGWARGAFGPRSRSGMAPRRRLNRDLWALPLGMWGWWVAGVGALLATVAVLNGIGVIGGWWFLGGCEMFLILTLQVVFRPFNSTLIGEALTGRRGRQPGDFLRAWSRLPVHRTTVLRRVWLHGMVSVVATWLAIVVAVTLRTWLITGSVGLRDGDGDPIGALILPAVLVAPMAAAFLVSAAAGGRWQTIFTGLCLMFAVHSVFLVHLAAAACFPGREVMVAVITVGYGLLLVAGGSLAPVGLLVNDGVNGAL